MRSSVEPIPVEEQFQIMADSAPVMIWICGRDKQYYYFNAGFLRFTGKSFEKEIGTQWIQGIHPDDRNRFLEIFTASFQVRREFKIEYRLRRFDGQYRFILDHGIPRYDEDGAFIGFIGSCMEIHEIRESEERREEFINVASHELKTPLTSLKLYLELMNKQLQKDNITKYDGQIKKMYLQVEKLTKLVRDLLDVSKLETGRLNLNVEVFDINEFIYEAISDLQESFSSFDLVVKAQVRKEIRGDRERLKQVITNLIQNATKYSKNNTTIFIDIHDEGSKVIVSIQDFGIGIDKEHLPKIFERFYRVPEVEEKTFPGMGIGLYFSSEIIKQHGGEMWAESQKGKGSTFFFSLPVMLG